MQILQRGLADKQSELVDSEQRRSQQVYDLQREKLASETYLSEQLAEDKQRACVSPRLCTRCRWVDVRIQGGVPAACALSGVCSLVGRCVVMLAARPRRSALTEE